MWYVVCGFIACVLLGAHGAWLARVHRVSGLSSLSTARRCFHLILTLLAMFLYLSIFAVGYLVIDLNRLPAWIASGGVLCAASLLCIVFVILYRFPTNERRLQRTGQ